MPINSKLRQINRVKSVVVALILVLATIGTFASFDAAMAQSEPVRFLEGGLESSFPESIRFYVSLDTYVEIEDVRVRFSTGPITTGQYDYLDLTERSASVIEGELEWRVNTSARYIPPGTTIEFVFEVIDIEGNEYASRQYSQIMLDSRYEWEVVSRGPIYVYYHGPVQVRAERLAEAAKESMELMGPITGSEIETPIVVTLYNNNAEMIGAVSARSATISRELITEGQAFYDHSVVLVLSGNRDIGTLTHELTHILVGRAARGGNALVPLWLNEGLAEYGNLDKGLSYVYYLDWAVDTNRLIPFSRLQTFPGEPNMVIVSYGQSRDFVEYLIEIYGTEKIAETLASIAEGRSGDIAIRNVYGKTVQQLDNEWRESIGADVYVPPTPIPTPAGSDSGDTSGYRLLTLTPTEGGITVGEAGASLTPEPTNVQETAHTVEPTVKPETEVMLQPTATEDAEQKSEASEEAYQQEPTSSGGLCNSNSNGPIEASTLFVTALLTGLLLVRGTLRGIRK